jgi:hypothetical protein
MPRIHSFRGYQIVQRVQQNKKCLKLKKSKVSFQYLFGTELEFGQEKKVIFKFFK